MEDGLKLLDHLQRACGEIGQAVEPLSVDELRTAGLATDAFLRECREAQIDARELLQTLARRWSQLRGGVLRDDGGRQIYLPGCVCFLSFYRHRHAVIEWLNANQ